MSYCMLLCWPHPSALVAKNGGTNVGHGPVRTLFLSLILFLVLACPWFGLKKPSALCAILKALGRVLDLSCDLLLLFVTI